MSMSGELSKRSGLSPDRVKAIVLGRWTPSAAERASIAAVFDVTPQSAIFDGAIGPG